MFAQPNSNANFEPAHPKYLTTFFLFFGQFYVTLQYPRTCIVNKDLLGWFWSENEQ